MNWKAFALPLFAAASGCVATGHPPSTRANTSLDTSRIVGSESSDWDTPPKLLKGKAPIYPVSLVLSKKSGTSVITYTIGEDGRPKDFEIQSATDEKYANHAIITMKEWVYQPATKGGVPIAARVRQTFEFKVR
ncbi:TonB family protein [Lysobacter sp. A3-1-A15]|uniref:TonB family protein n=1 Tax=Novilysobacter viscosus TaxID=3098602 RepID=UPI0039836F3E